MLGRTMILANASNGLALCDWDEVCMFQSQHAHHAKCGYFRMDAMPHRAAIHIALGGVVEIVDGSSKPRLSDALRKGVPTWCMVFNRAARFDPVRVCDWQTPHMMSVARSAAHKQAVSALRKLMSVYPPVGPAIVGQNVLLRCERVSFDDKPEALRAMVAA